MFSTLRIAVVVGVIYYLSPVRNEDARAGAEHVWAWGKGLVAPSRDPHAGDKLEALWKALPEDARQAAIDRMLAEAGRQLAPKVEEPPPEPKPPAAPPIKHADAKGPEARKAKPEPKP